LAQKICHKALFVTFVDDKGVGSGVIPALGDFAIFYTKNNARLRYTLI